ncbi:MAG: radical SAM protein [Clostridia bacterium]|nr:radical SAM protein [Clostridia bacterium]
MTRLRIPRVVPKPKDFSKLPWTEEFRDKFPTRRVAENAQNIAFEDLRDYLFAEKHVDYRKAKLLTDALKSEKGIVRNDNEILLTVNFPFCEWRCMNCKRNMYQKEKCSDAYMYYFDAIMREIELTREIIKKKCFIVKAICFTGNILALDEPEMEKVLSACTYSLSEMSIELGSPRLVTRSKLEILKKYNVTRIIVNALTYNTVTLRKLCRRYEFKDIYEYYKLIAEYGFDLSVELTMGLLGERELQLKRNIELAIELGANCIDLYSRCCPYDNSLEPLTNPQEISKIRKTLEFANEKMAELGFNPYFLYCTEVENGCFESVGYALGNHKCRFMEDRRMEISTVIGCGSDTQTVLVKNLHNTRKYLKNTYDMGQYVLGIDEILDKKRKFFE